MLTFAIASYTLLNRAFPLGVSFVELMRQAQLEASLKRALLNRTITFQRVELVKSDVNWLSEPPQVRKSAIPLESTVLLDSGTRTFGLCG